MTQRHITSENQNTCYLFKSLQSSVHRKNKKHVWMLKVSRTSFDLLFKKNERTPVPFVYLSKHLELHLFITSLCFVFASFRFQILAWSCGTAQQHFPSHHRNLTLNHLEFHSHCFKILINTLNTWHFEYPSLKEKIV